MQTSKLIIKMINIKVFQYFLSLFSTNGKTFLSYRLLAFSFRLSNLILLETIYHDSKILSSFFQVLWKCSKRTSSFTSKFFVFSVIISSFSNLVLFLRNETRSSGNICVFEACLFFPSFLWNCVCVCVCVCARVCACSEQECRLRKQVY